MFPNNFVDGKNKKIFNKKVLQLLEVRSLHNDVVLPLQHECVNDEVLFVK